MDSFIVIGIDLFRFLISFCVLVSFFSFFFSKLFLVFLFSKCFSKNLSILPELSNLLA